MDAKRIALWVGGVGLAGLSVALLLRRRAELPAFDLAGYLRIAETIPPVGFGDERDLGSQLGKDGAASVGSLLADADRDDVTALARMFASETDDRFAWVVLGWITVQRAKRAGRSVYDFVTRGKGYGSFYDSQGNATGRHASTAARPTAEARKLAELLIAGQILPPAEVLQLRPGAWIERRQTLSDEKILAKQAEYKEGIYAVLGGKRPWVLFSKDAPIISIAPFESASARLDAVKIITPGVSA